MSRKDSLRGTRPSMNPRRRSAFSLMEIILVVVIIGMLAALVMPNLLGSARKARIKTAEGQLSLFRTALTEFALEAGRFPTEVEGLQALIEKPATWPDTAEYHRFLEARSIRKDPWGRDYVYKCPGVKNPDSYDLTSLGPDGEPDSGDDIDITR